MRTSVLVFLACAIVTGCGNADTTISTASAALNPGPGSFCYEICPFGALAMPTAPDNPWQPGQYGYVVAGAPTATTPSVRVTIGLDSEFSNMLWWRVSKAYNADGTPSSDADTYKSLPNTIQYNGAFGPPRPEVSHSASCASVCFGHESIAALSDARCIPPYYPDQACAAQNFSCGTITSTCFTQSVNCGTCWFGYCQNNACALLTPL
jgi:hypothetical protein